MAHRLGGQHVGAVNVVAYGFPGVFLLHQRHVFVGCRMENDLRPVFFQRPRHPFRIFDIADHADDRHALEAAVEFLLNLVESKLRQFV